MHIFIVTLLALLPQITLGANAPTDFKSLVSLLTNILGTLVTLTFVLTFIAFLWGVVKGWIIDGGSAEGVKSGKNVVIVGVIAFVIMISVWGILTMLQSSLFSP
ncbi:hypothetical protein IPH92_02260 [Candidatus Kaiserbacteria bacterium]|nr:MAG: hypothetical protein IPH92_02260 [Candidatus Kaiserbacteria bacterium]